MDCNVYYVGQTSRKLKSRVYEHQRDVRLKNQHSALAAHHSMYKYSINFDRVKILDKENNYFKRLLSEMMYIEFQTTNINRIHDTQNLHPKYKNIIKALKNHP